MEPLSVLSLGAVILEFVQYTDEHCRIFRNLCDDNYNDFREGLFFDITRHFMYFAAVFKAQPPTESKVQSQALNMLLEGCHKIAAEMRVIFYKMAKDEEVKDNNVQLVLRIKKAKEFWNESEVYRILSKLESYNNQVAPCMLAIMPAHLDAMDEEQSARSGTMYRSYGKITEILTVVDNNLESLEIENINLRRAMGAKEYNPNISPSRRQYEPAMAAVVTFQGGTTRFLTRTGMANPYSHDKQLKVMVLRDADRSPVLDDFTSIQDLVLRTLIFPKFYDRIKLVKEAHHETYEWAFCPPEAGKPWSPLVGWLEDEAGCYYIKGKPGSGKSTLMKFIAQHQRLAAALGKWAGNDLISASFFFWNLGSPLHKSSVGLLRGLLYDILRQRPWLISVAMPELWRAAVYLPPGGSLSEPSLEELKQWFLKISDGWGTGIKFFFMLDGIDEFESDHKELVDLLHKVVEGGKVKILLSSRPTPLSEDSFSRWPSLRLQDLTRGDIRKYAEDHLSTRVKQKHGEQWVALIDEITEKSYGVFLWVFLVVKSLKEGFIKGDNIQEMRKRLVELPSDLESLYDHIFQHLESRYRIQMSELFQLLLKAQQVQSSAGYPLLMQLSFCAGDPQQVLSLPMGSVDPEYCQDQLDETNLRIRSRSCGLIESREWQTNRISPTTNTQITTQFVDFIHRTVVEFLLLPRIWKLLITLTTTSPKHHYDPSPELFRSCVIMCKTLPSPRGIEPEISNLWHMADRALVFASMAEDSGNPVPLEHLKELDAVVTAHWAKIMHCFSRLGTCDRKGHWAEGYKVDPQRQHILHPNSFASVALFHGLEDYLTRELACGSTSSAMDTSMLLYTCLEYIGVPPWNLSVPEFDGSLTREALLFLDRQAVLRPRWANIAICALKSNSSDPNKAVVGGDSSWSLMVSYIVAAGAHNTKQTFHRDLEAKDNAFAHTFAQLIDTFIRHGADLGFCSVSGGQPAWRLIEQLFSDQRSSRINPWAREPVVKINTEVMIMREYFESLLLEYRGSRPG
ncbi:hypothetical protein BKA65DRAFT_240002 [Rhexocercosporidium sp. MPI-PUGE-AT-0058]|nr:hypothetical protein BKA65DRAFT_240002 [Rhexocercosporidium sp. MPI-PUGE-AT-0058]